MMEVLTRRVAHKNPYSIEALPLLARLHQAAWGPSPRMRQEISRMPLRPLFKLAYRLGLGGKGTLSLDVKGRRRSLSFNARNLQFTSLYMPQHEQGYETETAALLDALVTERAVFYDVGSNWGYYSLWLAGRSGYEGRVHAFEPMASSFQDLQALVGGAGLADQISCHNIGLSDSSTEGRMIVPDGLHSGLAAVSQGREGLPISLKRLDDLDLPAPDVVKMDVEDHEVQALTGGLKSLGAAKPHLVFENIWGRRNQAETLAPFKILEDLGYAFFHPAWLEPSLLALVPFEPPQRFLLRQHLNVLACHKEKIASLAAIFVLPRSN